jgi:hypothetical protein
MFMAATYQALLGPRSNLIRDICRGTSSPFLSALQENPSMHARKTVFFLEWTGKEFIANDKPDVIQFQTVSNPL